MIPVILSGGSGTRLWPVSRPMFPKQFLTLTSDYTMFQETLLRVQPLMSSSPLVIANHDHRFMVADNLRQLGYDNSTIVLEENGRNTAPAIAAACFLIVDKGDDIVMVLPADHLVEDTDAFGKASEKAMELARRGYLVTFGIQPNSPNVNYGYIETGEILADGTFALKSFKEKPDEKTAQSYVNAGRYLWNSGMFVFRASVYLEELRRHAPDIYNHARAAVDNAQTDLDFLRLSSEDFEQCDNISIDYAVMEKTTKGAVVALDAPWCDVGSWDALWSVLPKDDRGNVTQGDIVVSNSDNSYIYSDNKFVSVLGVRDLIIADTKDALLVAHKSDVANLKTVVEKLKAEGRSEGTHHRTVHRPWGFYDLVDSGEKDEVKRITVQAGKKVSEQMHKHRAEHWVVVKGTATITQADERITLSENQSIFIPAGVRHSLANEGTIPLEIIEIKTGDYLGEDDIVRY